MSVAMKSKNPNSLGRRWSRTRTISICAGLIFFLITILVLRRGRATQLTRLHVQGSRKIAMVMVQIPKPSQSLPVQETSSETSHESIIPPIEQAYELCIQNHIDYCVKHDYPLFVDRANHSGRLPVWQKIVALMRIMQDALETGTLEWLFWTDSDTIILNNTIQLESFIPPEELSGDEDTIPHVLMSRDHRGWNAGVFMIRVHPWSFAFLARTLTWPDYVPAFRSTEQTAMARLYEDFEDVRRHMVNVPMRWFNGYPTGKSVYTAKPDDFQIHYPGSDNKEHMMNYVLRGQHVKLTHRAQGHGGPENSLTIAEFWQDLLHNESARFQIYPHQ